MDDSESPLSPSKRRKVRKGTHTCWECKRRKVRCIFAAPEDAVCTGCAKRCLRCVSQEYPEETTSLAAKSRLVGERIVRVEQMVRQLAQANGQTGTLTSLPTPVSSSTTASHLTPISSASGSTPVSASSSTPAGHAPVWTPASPQDRNLEKLSTSLLAAFPCQQDLDLIASVSTRAYRVCQVIFRSEREIQDDGFWPAASLATRHPPQTHPVTIACQMFLLAILIQMSEPADLSALMEPCRVIMDRLVDTASTLVSRNDELLDTIQGLLCIMLEAVYRGNTGHLRRSWLTWRRALSLGQLMCLPRQAIMTQKRQAASLPPLQALPCPGHQINPQFLWYRLIATDRFMCLLLGLEQTAMDAPVLPVAVLGNDTPTGRLEYGLSHIAAYILGRNERDPRPDDYATTQRIDREMQDLAASLPSRWWLPPNLAADVADSDEVWELTRFKLHIFYYNLLNQLHLPYMMRPTATRTTTAMATAEDQRRYEYSRMACVSASREVLTRYISLRSSNQIVYCCRFAEFFALLASLTLLLIHIDGHRTDNNNAASACANLLAHQRLSDRAMAEETLESMKLVGRLNEEDAVCESSVDLLRQLLAIEADAVASGTSHLLASCPDDVRSEGQLRLTVPYVGVIAISRNGAIYKEAPGQAPVQAVEAAEVAAQIPLDRCFMPCLAENLPPDKQLASDSNLLNIPADLAVPPEQAISLQMSHPGPTASIDQWAFQGVDMAFFDSLMRESAVDPQGNGWM